MMEYIIFVCLLVIVACDARKVGFCLDGKGRNYSAEDLECDMYYTLQNVTAAYQRNNNCSMDVRDERTIGQHECSVEEIANSYLGNYVLDEPATEYIYINNSKLPGHLFENCQQNSGLNYLWIYYNCDNDTDAVSVLTTFPPCHTESSTGCGDGKLSSTELGDNDSYIIPTPNEVNTKLDIAQTEDFDRRRPKKDRMFRVQHLAFILGGVVVVLICVIVLIVMVFQKKLKTKSMHRRLSSRRNKHNKDTISPEVAYVNNMPSISDDTTYADVLDDDQTDTYHEISALDLELSVQRGSGYGSHQADASLGLRINPILVNIGDRSPIDIPDAICHLSVNDPGQNDTYMLEGKENETETKTDIEPTSLGNPEIYSEERTVNTQDTLIIDNVNYAQFDVEEDMAVKHTDEYPDDNTIIIDNTLYNSNGTPEEDNVYLFEELEAKMDNGPDVYSLERKEGLDCSEDGVGNANCENSNACIYSLELEDTESVNDSSVHKIQDEQTDQEESSLRVDEISEENANVIITSLCDNTENC